MMPDDVAQACHDGEGEYASTVQGYQSVWMAHWMHTSCRSAALNRNGLSVGCEIKEVKEGSDDAEQHDLLGGSEVAVDDSGRAAPLGEVDKDTKFTFMNEADCGKSKKPSFGSKSFPIFNVSQKTDGILSLKREWNSEKFETKSSSGDDGVSLYRTGCHLPSTSAHAPPKTETSVRDCQLSSQGILPTAWLMKTPNNTKQKELAVSTSSVWNDSVKSDSAIVPSVRDKGKGLMSPFKSAQDEIYQSSYNLASQEYFTTTKYHSYSLLIREKKTSSLLDPQRSSFSRWIQRGMAHLPQDPIAGSDDESCFIHGQHHNIHSYIVNENITNQTAFLESTKPKKFCGGSSLVPQLLHDVETMKTYTNTDSVEESSRGHPKVSQTTHHFLMSKKTDVNLSDRGQFFRESIAPTKFKRNSFSGNLDISPPMTDHAMEGAKLEALGSSIKNDTKEIVQDLRSLKNESSTETDKMDIHALHESHLPGNVPLQMNKYSKDSQNSPMSPVAMTSAREKAKAKSTNTPLPDMNQVPHEDLTLASPVVDKETSTSRTHSLSMEHFLSHVDEHSRSKSGNSSLGPDPCSRWVKRLKLCSLGSSHGTKNAKIGESSHEKVNNIVSKNTQGTKPSMEPEVVLHAEEKMIPDLPARELTNGKSSCNESKRTSEITLSHPWIQRWSHPCSGSFPKKQLYDPKSSNNELEELQKEQFPSIAAMALMGKAMNNLNPCQVMKKGPVMVWNAKGF